MNRVRLTLVFTMIMFTLWVSFAVAPAPSVWRFSNGSGDSMVVADEPTLLAYELHGTTLDYQNGSYRYSSRLGETNIWNGTGYIPYIWDDVTREIHYFENHTVEFYDWYVRITNATHTLVDDARWQVYYWTDTGGGKWNFLDLWSHSWLEPVFSEENMTFGQHYEDGMGNWLNMKYTIANWDIVKITAELHVIETNQYQLVWQLSGLQGDPVVVKDKDTNFTEGVSFGKVAVGWWDVVSNNNLNATFDWEVSNKKLDVQFGNFTVNAGETYILDPSVQDVEIGADSDDTEYQSDSGFTNNNGQSYNQVGEYYDNDRWHAMRWSLAIVEDSDVTSARIDVYQQTEEATTDNWLNRITEDNPGSLEADTSVPAWTTTDRVDIDLNTNGGWEASAGAMDAMVETHVAQASWESGDYMAFLIDEPGGQSDGDSVRDVQSGTGAEITVWWTVPNTAPVVVGDPVGTNLDDGDNLYARYKAYEIDVEVSDAEGYADIDYVRLTLYDYGSTNTRWRLKYTELTNAFTEDLGGDIIEESGSTYDKSGNTISLTFKFYVEWTHPDATDDDLSVYVIDEAAEGDTNFHDSNYDFETRLDLSPYSLSDGSGTLDRGHYNVLDGITASGTVIYFGSVNNYPASTHVDVWVSSSGVAGSPWSDLTLTSGAFSMTVDSDDVVGLDAYPFIVVLEGAGSGGTNQLHEAHSVNYIADRVQVQSYTVVDNRVSTNINVNIDVLLYYDYLNEPVIDGSVTITGSTFVHQGSGTWRLTRDSSTVQGITYDTVVVSGNEHGITLVDQNSKSQLVIWDNVQVQSYLVSDSRDNINDNVNIDVTVWYDYDNTALTDGVLGIEGHAATHQGSGVWRIVRTSATVQSITYNEITAVSGNTHGIITEDQNGQSTVVIWDQIVVQTTLVVDSRVNINDNVEIRVTLWLDYDDVYLGSGDSVTIDDVSMAWDAGNSWWDLTRTKATVGAWGYYVNSSSEATYGITALNLNSNEVDVIWDRVRIVSFAASDERVNINDNVDIDVELHYDYDEADVADGTVTIDGFSASYQGSGVWRITRTSETVILVTYNAIVLSGNTYGITVIYTGGITQDVIWDQIEVFYDTASDARTNMDEQEYPYFRLRLKYDNHLLDDGTNDAVSINGSVATWSGSGATGGWYKYYTQVTVGSWNFLVTSVSEDTYGIIAFDSASAVTYDVDIIWDRVQVIGYSVSDNRVNINDNVNVDVTLDYDYDNTDVTDGTVTINGLSASHQGSGVWRVVDSESSVVENTYDNVQCSGNTYGITVEDQNGQSDSVIWDSLTITMMDPTDQRDDLNENATGVVVSAVRDFDSSAFDGSFTLNNTDFDGDGTAVKWGYTVTSVSGGTYGITTISSNDDTYMIWDKVTFVFSVNMTWTVVNYYVNVSWTSVYDYDDTSYLGTETVFNTGGVITFDTVANRTFYVSSIDDSGGYDITGFATNTVWCVHDDIDITSGPDYYWTQYDVSAVWLIWGIPSVYAWTFNSTDWLQQGAIIQSYTNSSAAAKAAIWSATGDLNGLAIGPFNPTWYHVNLSVSCEVSVSGQDYDFEIWQAILIVDILHSIHIEDSGMDIQDNWITFYFHSNWNNGTFYVWDNSSLVGSSLEGWYQIAKPTVVGLHNYTILVNGSASVVSDGEQAKDFSVSDSWTWLNFKFTVNPVTLSITDLLVMQNNVSIVLSGWIHTPNVTITWEAFEHDVSIENGTIVLSASGEYHAVYWEKNEPLLLKNFTLTLTADGSSLSVYGYSYVIDTASYITTSSAGVFNEGDTINNEYYPEDTGETGMWFTMLGIIFVISATIIGGIVYKATMIKENRKKKPDRMNDIYRTPGGKKNG